MNKPLEFKASLHAIRIDKEGESKVTFCLPQSEIKTVALLSAATEMGLSVIVRMRENGT